MTDLRTAPAPAPGNGATPAIEAPTLVKLPTREPGEGERRRVRVPRAVERLAGVAVLFALWQLAASAGWLRPDVLAGPDAVLTAGWDIVRDATLLHALWASVQRVAWGLGLGIPLGTGLALVAGLSRVGDDVIDANLQMLRFVPILGLQPLLIVWLGVGETTKVTMIVLGVAFPIYVNTSSAIRAIDPRHLELSDVVGLGRIERIRKVVLPGARAEVFEIDYTAARTNLYSTYGDLSTRYRGIYWHTDVTFVKRPPLGSILRAVVVPPAGGDTLFSDQQAAFAGLSRRLREFLSTLTAVHDGQAQFKGILDQVGEGRWEGDRFTELEPVEHPVVRTHPETGAQTLFVNPGFTSHIKELDRAESDALLAYLFEHSVKPEYTVRYHWHDGDVGFWDNRSTQHAVAGDFGDQHRVIQRVTLRGDEPA